MRARLCRSEKVVYPSFEATDAALRVSRRCIEKTALAPREGVLRKAQQPEPEPVLKPKGRNRATKVRIAAGNRATKARIEAKAEIGRRMPHGYAMGIVFEKDITNW